MLLYSLIIFITVFLVLIGISLFIFELDDDDSGDNYDDDVDKK